MSSNEITIQVKNLSKCYNIYNRPQDRLKQSVVPRLQQLVGKPPKHYFHEFWALGMSPSTSGKAKPLESLAGMDRENPHSCKLFVARLAQPAVLLRRGAAFPRYWNLVPVSTRNLADGKTFT